MILITGYDSRTGEFIFRNSWGPDWGDRGYGRIPERYILEDCEMCHHLDRISELPEHRQRMLRNAARGWSGELK